MVLRGLGCRTNHGTITDHRAIAGRGLIIRIVALKNARKSANSLYMRCNLVGAGFKPAPTRGCTFYEKTLTKTPNRYSGCCKAEVKNVEQHVQH